MPAPGRRELPLAGHPPNSPLRIRSDPREDDFRKGAACAAWPCSPGFQQTPTTLHEYLLTPFLFLWGGGP